MVEERDGLIEKYKARRWLVRAARKNLPWEVQQRLFASLEALSYDCVIQILLDDPVEFKVLEDDDPHGMFPTLYELISQSFYSKV